MARISVCVPTYNAGHHFRPCLDSIASQSYSDIEVIISDDGSTDGTWETALEYAESDSRFSARRNRENLGLPRNWDAAITHSQGEWVKLMFQDDLMSRTCLESMLSAGETGRPFVVCDRDVLNETPSAAIDRYVARYNPTTAFRGESEVDGKGYAEALLRFGPQNFIGEPTCTLFTRDVYESTGGFDGRLAQFVDFDYWSRLALQHGLTHVPESLVTFRFHASNASNDHRPERAFRATSLDRMLLLTKFEVDPQYSVLRDLQREVGAPLVHRHEVAHSLPALRGAAWRLDVRTRGRARAQAQLHRLIGEFPVIAEWEQMHSSAPRRFVVAHLPVFRKVLIRVRAFIRKVGRHAPQ